MSFIVTANWLNEKLHNSNENVVVIDVRSALNDNDIGRKKYDVGHIPHAVYLDLNTDLSGEVKVHGGNHPLPDINEFANKMGAIGIDHQTTVVIYDDYNDMFSARMWWLLHYMGHEHVYLLDGGFKNWVETGHKITTEVPHPTPTTFKPQLLVNETVTMEEVKQRHASSILIDSRARDRYLGNTEPLYKKSGHIPGAKNFVWQGVLDEEGMWKNHAELQSHFATLSKDAEIIVSCGSGISACPNIVALKEAGYKNVKLYPGSFSDWISYEDNPVATGDE